MVNRSRGDKFFREEKKKDASLKLKVVKKNENKLVNKSTKMPFKKA